MDCLTAHYGIGTHDGRDSSLDWDFFGILTTVKTIYMVRIFGVLLQVRICLAALVIYLMNLVWRSISGTCLFAPVIFIPGPSRMFPYIIGYSGGKSPSAWRVFMWNPRFV